MTIYVITGKLGSGKTLCAISKIKEYLERGRLVVTNLDINVHNLFHKRVKHTRVYRVPDHPKLEDVEAIGRGYKGDYDEAKNGAIVLDECGTWLNARDWQDSTKRPLLDYLLHIRKRGWDVFFIVQDISMMDKQFRKALAEHVVYCRRMDRMRIPFIGWFISLFGLNAVMPRLHIGIVKYGDTPTSLTVDQWYYRGSDLFTSYNTRQVFIGDNDKTTYMLLPPFYVFKDIAKRNVRFFMRLTKIYGRKYSRALVFVFGMLSVTLFNYYLTTQQDLSPITTVVASEINNDNNNKIESQTSIATIEPKIETLSYSENWRLNSYFEVSAGKGTYLMINNIGATRRVSADLCQSVYGDVMCEMQGELVTFYTGNLDPHEMD